MQRPVLVSGKDFHELSNLLMSIRIAAETLSERASDAPEIKSILERLESISMILKNSASKNGLG